MSALQSLLPSESRLLPGLFQEREQVNREYLMRLNSVALLQNFYLEAGIILPDMQVMEAPDSTPLHWGWEAPTCQLRGHFLGHWMSAAARYVATYGDGELRAKLEHIVSELARCQKLNGGEWIGSIPEKYFTKLETGDYIWSPQYTLHKTLMGLYHAWRCAGIDQAREILERAANWYLRWTASLKDPWVALKGEAGGMLELWADLYGATGRPEHLRLAECYGRSGMFDQLLAGGDPLTNSHMNASIPWAQGAARMYEVTKEERWLRIAERFWQCGVEERAAYCTGGQGAGEFWTPPRRTGEYLGERNQEFCTVYNMVRLADYLLRFTGDKKYADYIERNLYNGFLAQQHPRTGMVTYFLPMSAGSKKKWGTPTRDFWCCYGTMVQAQTLYPALCWYKGENRLCVAQYIPSECETELDGHPVRVSQRTDMKYYNDQAFFDESDASQLSRWQLSLRVRAASRFRLALRLPEWLTGDPVVTVDGREAEGVREDGWLVLDREWTDNEVRLYLPCGLSLSRLPDQPEMAAVSEGPIVLAGLGGGEQPLAPERLRPVREHTYSTYPWLQSTYRMGRTRFVPLYEVTDEAYTLYWETEK